MEVFKSEFNQRQIEYGDLERFVAFIDLSEGKHLEGILFEDEEVIYKIGKFEQDEYYWVSNFYLSFSSSDLNKKYDPRKINYVLDKIHRITEEKDFKA